MRRFKTIRKLIIDQLLNRFSNIDDIISITFVGSFVEKDNFNSISDIDIIVIVDKLNKNVFDKIKIQAKNFDLKKCGLSLYNLKLNMTFGPLKFNSDNDLVFHLMVYDIEGHKSHVVNSPFTCLDWEKHDSVYGKNLRDIYSAFPIQLNYLFNTRRSLTSYLNDVKGGYITYREYDFKNDNYCFKKKKYKIDKRHINEYGYHILKFIILNFVKTIHQKNIKYSDRKLTDIISKITNDLNEDLYFFENLSDWKNFGKNEPKFVEKKVEKFINNFSDWYSNFYDKLPDLIFMRHAKTKLNDKSFLGQGRDPDIINFKNDISKIFDIIFSSKLTRAISTSLKFNYKKFITTSFLNEINYGEAEGLNYKDFSLKYKSINDKWLKGIDEKFPNGENQFGVQKRVFEFINRFIKTKKFKSALIVSHNVILRTLLINFFSKSVQKSYLIQIKHLDSFNFKLYNNILITDFSEDITTKIKNSIHD